MGTGIWQYVDTNLLQTVSTVVAGGFVFLIQKGYQWLKAQTANIKDNTVRTTLLAAEDEADRLMTKLVQSANQTEVDALKAQNGGHLSPSDAERIKNAVMDKAVQLLSPGAQGILDTLKGGLQNYLAEVLQAAVGNEKQKQTTAGTPGAVPAVSPVSINVAPSV